MVDTLEVFIGGPTSQRPFPSLGADNIIYKIIDLYFDAGLVFCVSIHRLMTDLPGASANTNKDRGGVDGGWGGG